MWLVVNVEGKSGEYKSGVFDILTLLLRESGELWHLRKSWPLCITDGPAMRPPLLLPTAWKFISASQFLLQPRMPPNCHCKVFIEHVSFNHLGIPTNPKSFNPSLWDGSANQHGGSLIGSMQVSSQHPPLGLVNHSLPKIVETIHNKILWGVTWELGIWLVSAVGNPF